MSNDLEHRVAMLEREVETLLGINAGIFTALAALIVKHPDHEDLVYHLAALTELADQGALGKTLNERQRGLAREYLEQLQGLKAVPRGRRPLDPSR